MKTRQFAHILLIEKKTVFNIFISIATQNIYHKNVVVCFRTVHNNQYFISKYVAENPMFH